MADISAKLQSLVRELNENRARELRLARWSHWLNISAMFTTLVTTGIAVVYGLMPNHSSQITAGLALLPGGIALLATSLKLQARCDWHYKKHYALASLIRKIDIELPDQPTQEQVTEMSPALSRLEMDTEGLWEKDLSLDWKRFERDQHRIRCPPPSRFRGRVDSAQFLRIWGI